MMESRFVATNGITLHCIDHGGDGPVLILTPGLTANARFFDAVVEDGLGAGVRVIAVDLRGRGLSDKPDTGYTMADHARDILGLLDAMDIDEFVMGGHSFGGLLTYFLAANHSERIARCVVLDAPGEVDTRILDQIGPSLARLEASVPSFDRYLAAVRAQPYFADWWDPRIEAYYHADVEHARDGSVRARSSPDHIRQAIEGTLTVDWPDVVARIDQPTLVVRAVGPFGPEGSPPILPADVAQRTVALLGHGTLTEIEGNHITAFFGTGASTVAQILRSFVLEEG